MEPVFKPTKPVRVRTMRNVKLEYEPERYAELQALAAKAGVSLKEYLRQAVDFAVEHRAK